MLIFVPFVVTIFDLQ